jgi:alpha-beta hydrolase superfamily lysophospholipase
MIYSETNSEVIQVDDQTSLLTRIWMPKTSPKAVLLALHGGMAHAGDWVTPALYFMEKGIATYAPDLRWHGTYPKYNKGGKVIFHADSYDETVSDVHKIYKKITEKHPGVPVFVISHSNGALNALKYGLTLGKDTDIKGFILSSPWLKNKVEISPIVISMSKFLSKIVPMMPVTPEPLTDKLTHDKKITERHHADEASGIRGTQVTVRLGAESMKTQEWVVSEISKWEKFPVFGVIAGEDYLSDPDVSVKALESIKNAPVTIHRYDENYHENFNELNRETIFGLIAKWIDKLLSEKSKSAMTGSSVKPAAKPASPVKSIVKKKAVVKTKAASSSASKPKPKAAAKSAVKPKAKPAAKSAVKAKPKPAAKSAAKSKPKPAVKSAAKAKPKPAVKSAPAKKSTVKKIVKKKK